MMIGMRGRGGIAPEDLADLQAVHFRQHQVEDDQVGPLGPAPIARAFGCRPWRKWGVYPASRNLNPRTSRASGLVVNYQDLCLH
jgi:hypothetical protein